METYSLDDVSKIQFIDYKESEEHVSCPGKLLVTAASCHDNYMNADVYRKKTSPCFGCKIGNERRMDMAIDALGGKQFAFLIEQPSEHSVRIGLKQGSRQSPVTMANFKRQPLIEIIRDVVPGITAEQLREWIYKGWPPDADLRMKVAAALGTTANKVKWSASRST